MKKIIALSGALLCVCLPARADSLLIAGGHVAAFWPTASSLPSRARQYGRRQHHHDRRGPAIYARETDRPLELHPLLAIAEHYLGAGKFTRQPGPWCRDFINVVARRAGVRLANNSRRAIDALRLGQHVSSPRAGDLVVMRHHVTIFAGYGGRGVLGLGGNQHHGRVSVSSYPARQILAFVRL